MTIEEFALKSKETMIYKGHKELVTCMFCGILGEYKEVEYEINSQDSINNKLHKNKVLAELGDLAFYVYGLSSYYNYIPTGTTGECFCMDEHAPMLAEVIKKTIRDDDWCLRNEARVDSFKYIMETLHAYIIWVCEQYDFTLSEVLEYNVEKLQSRMKRGVIGGDGSNR